MLDPDIRIIALGSEPFDSLREAIDFRNLKIRLYGRETPNHDWLPGMVHVHIHIPA